MDWFRPLQDRPTVIVVLGFALLLNPFVVSALDIGDPDWYRYEAVEVEFHDDGTVDVPIEVHEIDSDVACIDGVPARRACMLERAVHASGGITYDGLSEAFLHSEYEYVFVYQQGFFEPVATDTGNGIVRYDMTPVPTAEALRYASTPLSRASPGVRTAISDGSYETSDELPDANELIETDDGYYVVYAASYHITSGPERAAWVVVLQWIAGFLGAGLVLHGQRRRVEQR